MKFRQRPLGIPTRSRSVEMKDRCLNAILVVILAVIFARVAGLGSSSFLRAAPPQVDPWSGEALSPDPNSSHNDAARFQSPTPDLERTPATSDYRSVVTEAWEDNAPVTNVLNDAGGFPYDLAWRKGDYTIVPYGALWGSAIYSTQRTFPGPYVLFVQSPSTQGEAAFEIDTRRTRLGLDITGPEVPLFGSATSGGKVEIDFHGLFLSENRAGVLLRHAYGEVRNEDWRLLAGQHWDLISPLAPTTIEYAVGWAAGNVGFRRMQVRLERLLHVDDATTFELQGAILQDIVTDSSTTALAESSSWPIVEWRTGLVLGQQGPDARPVTLGVSGHIGQQGFDFLSPAEKNARLATWSVNTDLRVPFGSRWGFQSEFFTGDNLGTFFGGIGQGVNLLTRQGIRATGGWCELWCDWTDRLQTHVGYGIDDPRNADLSIANSRTYNQFMFANVMFNVIPKLMVGLEVSQWKTRYLGQLPGEATLFEFTGSYGF